MLVIGSTALAMMGWPVEPKDVDLVGTHDEVQEFIKRTAPKVCYPISGDVMYLRYPDGEICEIEIAWPGSKAEKLLSFVDAWCETMDTHYRGQEVNVPEFNMLYLLKLSHRYKKDSPHFHKTMESIHWFRSHFAEIPDEWKDFLKEREKMTYTYGHPKLNVSKDTFFDQESTGVKYTYDHDTIHVAVANVWQYPAYLEYSVDGEEVMCSKEKFFATNYITRLRGVMEEAMVLALERSLIPFPGKKTPDEAFLFALQKVCTSITSGWFREFAWENYNEVVALFHETQKVMCYTERFRIGLEMGIVQPSKT